MGRPYKILRCFRTRGGTLHLPFEDIWSDVQTKVGTKYKIQAFLTEVAGGWVVGWVDGMLRGNDVTSWLHLELTQFSAKLKIQDGAIFTHF